MNEDTDSESSLLVVIFDTSLTQDVIINEEIKLSECLEIIITFVNSHLMLKSNNKIAMITCDSKNCQFIYPDATKEPGQLRQTDGQYELFTHVEKTIRKNVQQFLVKTLEGEIIHHDSLFGAACSIALCYINRLDKEKPLGDKMNSRILIITGCGNSGDQYIPCMNTFFTAQKQNVTIDVCSLQNEITLLQQACDITNGVFLKLPQLSSLLQYLLCVFLPDPTVRKKLVVPPPVSVDYRPFCFCHHELIDIGFVCSVCLAIYCKLSPICTTCEVVFKMKAPMKPMKVKKKKMIKS
uniref:General transcription factor IIH subunit 3 n=1 Tax=Cacopsylla melanoneura TaxID=428564 RepID=A0A8D8SPW0_9HEMI